MTDHNDSETSGDSPVPVPLDTASEIVLAWALNTRPVEVDQLDRALATIGVLRGFHTLGRYLFRACTRHRLRELRALRASRIAEVKGLTAGKLH